MTTPLTEQELANLRLDHNMVRADGKRCYVDSYDIPCPVIRLLDAYAALQAERDIGLTVGELLLKERDTLQAETARLRVPCSCGGWDDRVVDGHEWSDSCTCCRDTCDGYGYILDPQRYIALANASNALTVDNFRKFKAEAAEQQAVCDTLHGHSLGEVARLRGKLQAIADDDEIHRINGEYHIGYGIDGCDCAELYAADALAGTGEEAKTE